ncbi:hypothetical protein TRFO_38910 [Tritrichomonas foetus]|uniref:Uncharacterized protein n=1 Tax=Tritrichomonas foetus TaxID=1144522 RepID=A0A1J4J9N1_9EUKA|nr:hypothetical protein TRFO_38910 [Tritrichomonas foetus]|eukprot:OHS94935.1 hypothetical protein TRFO_38910 [Tritrichomonas foetus]
MNHDGIPDEDLEAIMIRILCLGEIEHLDIFLNQLNKKSIHLILKSLLCSQLPSLFKPTKYVQSPLKLRWIISRVLLRNDFSDVPFFNYDQLADIEFQKMNDKCSQNFRAAMEKFENNIIINSDESKIIQFAGSFIQFNAKHPSMAQHFLNSYAKYFSQVSLPKLINNFQFQCFHLFSDVEKVEVPPLRITFTGYSNFEELFQVYRTLLKGNVFQTIQGMMINDNLYPNSLGNDPDNKVRSLIDTSLQKSCHFIDILKAYSYQAFKMGKIDESIKRANFFDGMEYWILLSHEPKNTLNYFKNTDLPEFQSDSIAADYLNRIRNDLLFFSALRQNTGQNISEKDFLEHSIPFVLRMFLKSNDPLPFQNLSVTHFFCINDQNRLTDADFVWSFFAETVVIKSLTDMDNAEEIIAQAEWYLTQISDTDTQQKVLVDIFAIMFLQDLNSHYVCLQFVAEFILTMILNISDDPELITKAQNGHLLIQFARSFSGGMEFEDLIFPKKEQLFKALMSEDWLIADHIASLNSNLYDLFNTFKTVNEFKKKENSIFDPNLKTNQKSEYAALEIGLSFFNQKDSLIYVSKTLNLTEDTKELVDNRLKHLKNPLKPFKSLKKELFASLTKNFTRLSATNWAIPSFPKDQTKLHYLPEFLNYIDSFLGIVLNEEKLTETVFDALSSDPVSYFGQLYGRGRISAAEKDALLLKQDLMSMLITDKTASEKTIASMASENPIVSLTLLLLKEGGIDENPIKDLSSKSNAILYKLANLSLKSNLQNRDNFYQINRILGKSILHEQADDQNSVELINEIKEMFDKKLVSIERINEISYLLKEDEFSEIILHYLIYSNNFEIINQIVQSCASINSKLFDSVSFLKKYQNESEIYPLDRLFTKLLISHKFRDASLFMKYFGDRINTFDSLKNSYLNETPQFREEILSISPKDRSKLESSLLLSTNTNLSTNKIDYQQNESITNSEKGIDNLSNIRQIIGLNPSVNMDDEIINILQNDINNHISKEIKFDFNENIPQTSETSQNGNIHENEFYNDKYFSDDLLGLCHSIQKAILLIKDTKKLFYFISPIIIDKISGITVNSYDSETSAWKIMHKIDSILSSFLFSDNSLTQLSKKIQIFLKIVDIQPFSLLGIEYNFSNFGSNQTLALALQKIDCIDLLLNFKDIFQTDPQEELDSYALTCSQMGIYKFPKNEIKYSNEFFYKMSLIFNYNHFIEPSIVPTFTDTFPPTNMMLNCDWPPISYKSLSKNDSNLGTGSLSSESEIKDSTSGSIPITNSLSSSSSLISTIHFSENDVQTHFYDRIVDLTSHKKKPKSDNQSLKQIRKFFIENGPTELVVRFLSEKGKFASAMKLLNERIQTMKSNKPIIESNENDSKTLDENNYFVIEKERIFKTSIFETSLAHNELLRLVRQVKSEDDMFASILPFSGPYLRFELFSYLKQWMKAFKTAIELFIEPQKDKDHSNVRSLNLLSRAQNCLEEITEYSEEKEMKKCELQLQREFCIFIIDNKLNCDFSDMNLFQEDHQRESMVIFLLNNMNTKLAVAIIKFYIINPKNIGERYCDILFNESSEKITMFINTLENEVERKIFREIYYAIITRLAYVIELSKEDILAYINILKDYNFKSQMFLQFEFYEEAAQIAFNESNKELAALVAHEAHLLQKHQLFTKCMKFIEKS